MFRAYFTIFGVYLPPEKNVDILAIQSLDITNLAVLREFSIFDRDVYVKCYFTFNW
jgi:hypothetical protein